MDNDDKELQTFVGQNYFKGKQSEHLHLQKEVIQPLRKSLEDEQATAQHWLTEYKKLEAEIKALREAAQNLVTAIEQRSFFQEGYRNGSASISEVMAAGDVEVKAYEAMGKLLTKNEG
jgi:hypothetical protein